MIPCQIIPAEPGTRWVRIDVNNNITESPVVGWRVFETGKAIPVLLIDENPVVPGTAVEIAGNARHFDLTTGDEFDTFTDWRDWVNEDKPYRIGKSAETERLDRMTRPVLSFNGRVYAKTSFWKIAPPGQHISIFAMPGNHPSPTNPHVSKITRDDFYAARKTITEIPFEVLLEDTKPLLKDEPEDDAEDLI